MCENPRPTYLPANVTKAVESSLGVLPGPGGIEAPFARLVEEWSIIVPVICVFQLHVNDAAG